MNKRSPPMEIVLAALLLGCGGAALPVSSTGTGGAAGVGAAGAPQPAAAGASGAGVAGSTDGAPRVETIYDVPSGGVFACGVAPPVHTAVLTAVAPASPTLSDGKCALGAYKQNGVCGCQAEIPIVCGSTCTDVTRDPDNCGVCGRACGPTASCVAGSCGPSVTSFVPPAAGCKSLDLAASGGTMYWTDQGHGTVNLQPLDGCGATTIVSGEVSPTILVTDGQNLFWVNSTTTTPDGFSPPTTTATIRALALPDGAPRDLVTETNASDGIAGLVLSADGATLYYSTDTRVRAVPVAGGAAFDVGREERGGLPLALAREGNTIAFLTGFNGNLDAITVEDGVVASCGETDANGNFLRNAGCVRIGGCNGEGFPGGLIVRDGRVYWGDGLNVIGGSLPFGIKEVVAVADSDATSMSGLAAGPDAVYFAASASNAHGTIDRSPYAVGSRAVSIARGQNVPSSLVVAGTNVYWATADCAINTVQR